MRPLALSEDGLIQDVFTKEEPLGLVLMAVPIYMGSAWKTENIPR